MKRTIKRFLAAVLVLVMIGANLPLNALALTAGNVESFSVSNPTVYVDGTSDQTVDIAFYGTENDSYELVEGVFSAKDETGEIVISNIVAGYQCDGQNNYAQASTEYGGWFSFTVSPNALAFDKDVPIVTASYTVPKNIAPGSYKVSLTGVKAMNESKATLQNATYTATITVEEPSAPPPVEPPVETDEFELYYTLNSDANAADGYADYVMPTQNSVVATVYLKNNPAGAAYLQAFDLYLSHHEDLNYQSTDIHGDVTAVNDQLTRIQFVADKSNEYDFTDGEDLVLGTITFEIDSGVVYDADLNITLGANTNISVGDNRASGEEKTGDETGDKVSYIPEISTVLQGAEVKNTYEVTYDLAGGEGTATKQTKLYNIPLTLHSAPTKDGYTFEGWLGSDNVTYSAGQSYEVNAELALTAQWKETEYTVTIVDGDTTDTETVEYNGEFTVPTAAGKEGHEFTGWLGSNGATYQAGEKIAITGDITLTAQYSIQSFTITFVNEDGTELQSGAWDYGTTPSYSGETPTKAATAEYTYTFKEWTPEIVAVTGNATYKATYTATKNKYTITFVDEDGTTVLQSGDVEYGETPVYTGETPTKAATAEYTYTFDKWSPEIVAVTGEATYKATYTATKNKYTVTVVDGETKTTDVEYGATFTVPTAVGKEGWSFVNWMDGNGNVVSDATITITGPITLTANYRINQYTISFNTAGGTTIAGITKDYGADVGTVMDPTKTGYTFAGWDAEIPATMPAENVTINANWTANTYTVKFHPGQGSGTEYVQSFTYDEDKKALTENAFTAPSSSHVFAGWATTADDATNGVVTYNDKHAVQNLTSENGKVIDLYAVWKQDVFKINYTSIPADVDMDTDGLPGTYSSDKGETITAKPTVTGYTFTGWTVPDGITLTDGSVTIPQNHTGDVTLTANFTINQYTITFDTDGGSSVGPITQDYNTEVAAPEKPTKEGYTFDKWVDGEGQEVTFPMDMPAENVTITAQWTINQYTITFDTVGGTAIAPIKQDYNTTVTAPAAPTKTGYTFAGWDNEIPATMPAGDMTITAQWTINQYTITFDTDGGSTVAPITQDYATAVIAPAAPTKTGYTFAGWDAEIPANMPAGDMTITAQWTINQYTITFDTVGGTAIEAITQDYATAVTAPANPTKTGYTFAGWDKTIPTTMPAGDMTITAQWNINQYTITFDTVGGTAIEAITQDYNTAVTAPTAPTKTGYTFAGWDKTIPTTMPAEDLTITAKWNINQYTITFENTGDIKIDPITQNYGTDVTAPVAPTKTGYTFAGWDQNNDGTADGLPEKMPAGNLTVKAIWTATPYTITFMVPDGKEIEDMPYTIVDTKTLPVAVHDDPAMYSFDKWVVSYAADATEKGWGDAGVKVDAGSAVTNRFGNVTLTATWKKTADLYVEQYKYAGNDQFLLRVKDNLDTGSVYQFNSTAMYHTDDANYLVNSGDKGVFYILISGENLKKTAGGEYEVADNGSLVLTEDAYKLLKSGMGDRESLSDSCDINGDGAVNIADANIVYQMTQYTGNYYPDLSDEQRLLADQNTSQTDTDNDHRASITDVHAIVSAINGENTANP